MGPTYSNLPTNCYLLSGAGYLPKFVNDHWQFYLGLFLILVVLYAKRGLAGLLPGGRDG